ncbi:hypothetical protein B0A52_04517 [Exophiala mesophila]|uniref:Uncharacterized protein n=1 Tax=Exophiala mesophila TaxID=212818 RepID=A0A438N9L3_EXOME|nr:hypothetical protein B0A52_04517 [Exophiala mesophila]
MPHKISCIKFVDELTEEGRIIGAINTIYFSNSPSLARKRYIGTNTDCIGIRDAFQKTFSGIDDKSAGRPALVVGAGGTARAAVYALWKYFDVTEVFMINRFVSEIEELRSSMLAAGCTLKVTAVTTLQQADSLEVPGLFVGTVPDIPAESAEGLHARDLVSAMLQKLTSSEGVKGGFLLDMCYHPKPQTTLIELASKHGWQTVYGMEAVKYQAVVQNHLWS